MWFKTTKNLHYKFVSKLFKMMYVAILHKNFTAGMCRLEAKQSNVSCYLHRKRCNKR